MILIFGALAASRNLAGFGTDSAFDPPGSSRTVAAPTAPVAVATAPVAAAAARAALAGLETKPWASAAGYDRVGDFGDAWDDVDRNGCDTRNDILARDLQGIRRAANCKVLSGTLVSPYSGARVDFVKGERTSELVQIDHVVALADSWRTGAQQLSRAQRILLANDPLELLAVDGASNDRKGSQDAAYWLPESTGYHCAYVTRQIQVKAKYHLWVTGSERAAMARVLASCP
ncbi:hypothetical protein GCM10025867_26110 [Frondihabitans sucicola]|uniref:GmrSD restriction endonucleases C-terminal domain-containing protein n=1 Tax=Frondihabitans sucicola TaxID=1268041 RepID=A0ABN6Y3B4_9MICO|nr:hypothetical protein GCM10025867_26110 [Frondihabitans sucicola]